VKLIVLAVYVVGLALQLAGACGVIQEVRRSIGNMRRFDGSPGMSYRCTSPVADQLSSAAPTCFF
jgi:hypothetical protein